MGINDNYKTILLTGGTYDTNTLGNGISASTVHTVKCISAGNLTVTPFEGPSFTWTANVNDELNLLCRIIKINAGSFVGFKSKHTPVQYFNS